MSEVKDFVQNAHGDIDYVRTMLDADSTFAMLEHGARMDIFCAAILDEVDVVRALLPRQHDANGPHGIPLRAHAEAGKARHVIELLDSG